MPLLQSPSLDPASGFAHELKFLLAAPLADEIRAWARQSLSADPYGAGPHADSYPITSLYLDTPAFDVLRRTGLCGRGKYRIRRYGASENVFLERKMKKRGMISKRRSEVSVEQLAYLAGGLPPLAWPGYWYHRRIEARELAPVCRISYERTARMATTANGPIRLTLDDGMRAAPAAGLRFDPGVEHLAIGGGHIVLELKFRQELPTLFQEMMARFELVPQPASKYRMAGAALGLGIEQYA